MKKKLFRILYVSSTVVLLSTLMNSCKKTGSEINPQTDLEDQRQAAIQKVIKENGYVSRAEVISVDKQPDYLYYMNAQGLMQKIDPATASTSTASCTYNCSNTTNPADLVHPYTLQYIQRNYLCENTSKSELVAKWRISLPYTPLAAHPTNPSLTSYGVITVTGSAGTLSSGNVSIGIRTIGADPSCTGHTLYEITHTLYNVGNNYMVNFSLSASLRLYNNCSLLGYVVNTGTIGGVVAPNQAGEGSYNVPCERTDKVWCSIGNPGSPAIALGCYSVCWYPSTNFTPVTNHQIQWRLKTSATSNHWDDQTGTIYPATNTSINPYTGLLNLTNIVSGTGQWLVRYRNRNAECSSLTAAWTGVYMTDILMP